MAPPKFKDINKATADVLSKDYKLGGASVELNSTTSDGTSFKATADRKGEQTGASLELGKTLAPGIKLTEVFSANGTLNNKLEISKIKGLKLTGELSLPGTAATFSAAYSNPKLNFNAKLKPSMDLSLDATIAPLKGVAVGVSSAYGLTSGKVTMPCVMASYAGKDYSVVGGLNLTKGTQVTLDFHKRVNSALQAGVNINANVDKSVVLMAAGLQYNASKTTFYKARVDSLGVMGASFSQKLTDQVKFTMSAEMRSLADQANRVGAAFEFN